MSDGRETILNWLIEESEKWNDWRELKTKEQSLLQEIAQLSSIEYAEQISNELDNEKHFYTFETYLELLKRVVGLLQNNISQTDIKELIEIGWTLTHSYQLTTYVAVETLIETYQLAQASNSCDNSQLQ